jgi:hypothetical protein
MSARRHISWVCTAVILVLGGQTRGSIIQQVAQLPLGSTVHIDQAVILTTVNCSCCGNWSFRVRDDSRAVTVRGVAADVQALLAGRTSGDVISVDATTQLYGGILLLSVSGVGDVGSPTISRSIAPWPVNVADFQSHSATAESYESNLVRLHGVRFVDAGATFAKGDYAVTDGTTTALVQIARTDLDMVGLGIPSGVVDVTGIFDQTDFSAAMGQSGEGYHLQLLSYSGISPVPEPGSMAILAGAALMLLGRRVKRKY